MEETYEIDECLSWIKKNKFTKIVLQFSQQDLPDSPLVVKILEEKTTSNHEFFVVLTASCGVDFLAPLRLGSHFIQAVICFGSSRGSPCLNPSTSFKELPVLYCFGRRGSPNELQFVKDEIKASRCDSDTLILYDLCYSSLVSKLIESGDIHRNQVGKLVRENRINWSFTNGFERSLLVEKWDSKDRLGKFGLSRPLQSFNKIIWIGVCSDLFYRVNCIRDVTLIDPKEKTSSLMKPQKELIKRLSLVEKAKDAKTIGIVFTNILPRVDDVLQRTQDLIKKKRKQFILISLTQAVDNSKFGNFGEVDVFVLCSACSCGSLILTTETHVPLIDLTELDLALGVKTTYGGLEWNQDQDMLDDEESVIDTTVKTTVNSLMEYKTKMRSVWFGLEVSAGQTEIGDIKAGATGVASGYDNEPM